MDLFIIAAILAIAALVARRQQERQRIALLASYLEPFEIAKLMASLSDGYMRALGEQDPQRQQQVWDHLRTQELAMCEQFDQFAVRFGGAPAEQTRVSKLAWAIPWAHRLFQAATFDARKAMSIHARGIHAAVHADPQLSSRDRAFTLSAEMFLMQHTCHWFCRSRSVASARMWVRHKTGYQQLIDAVAPETASAYRALLAG